MSITAITIENFKGIKDPVRVELKPITLLFGPNSAGKSTIVQALHYAREIFERQNLDPDRTLLGGDAIDLGGFESFVYKHDPDLPIRIKFDLDLSNEDLPRYIEGWFVELGSITWEDESIFCDIPTLVQNAWVEIQIRWSKLLRKPFINSYQVGINGTDLAIIESSEDGKQINLSKLMLYNPIFLGRDLSDKIKAYLQDQGIDLENLSKGLSDAAKKWLQGNTQDIEIEEILSFGECFNSLRSLLKTNGMDESIPLDNQDSAMPVWGQPLHFHQSAWNDVEGMDEGQVLLLLSSLIIGPGELIRDELRKFCYVGPLREVPKRNHKPSTSPDESRWASGLAAYDTLFFAEDSFIEKVNTCLTQDERLATGYRVNVKKYRELEADNPVMLAVLQDRILDEDIKLRDNLLSLPIKRRLLIQDEKRDIELEPQDIGVGISQVLPVVVAALHRKTGFVVIEQPELHIHPAFQVALGDLFIEQIRECPDQTFILETHSEHLMLRFLRRIREASEQEVPENRKLTPEDLSIYFIEQAETGISCMSIRVDQDGDFIDRWPKGFFAERAKELF